MGESTTGIERKKIDILFDHLADDILSMSDDEIIEECIENGEDPEQVAAHCRAICLNAIASWEEKQKGKL